MMKKSFDSAITLGDYGCQTIGEIFQKIVDSKAKVLEDKKTEPLHHMRVGMRRLRTAIQVFSPAVSLPKAVSDRTIGKISRSLGKTRDLDVLQQELITTYQPLLNKSEQVKFDKVLKQAKQERHQSFRHLKKTLDSDRYAGLTQGIQLWLEHPTYTAIGHLPIKQVLPDLLLPLVCRLLLHPGWLVGTVYSDKVHSGKVTLMPIEKDAELNQQLEQFSDVLHDLRKLTKGVRYQSEFFSDFYEFSFLQRIDEFKDIQEHLGKLHDLVVQRQFLEASLNGEFTEVLPTVDQQLEQAKSSFWKNWQPLQAQYLDPEFRESLRSLLSTPME
jgi:CHAD domain-containing protein